MSDLRNGSWLQRHADLIYKLILVALIGLWIAFPPHVSQPSATEPRAAITIGGPA